MNKIVGPDPKYHNPNITITNINFRFSTIPCLG